MSVDYPRGSGKSSRLRSSLDNPAPEPLPQNELVLTPAPDEKVVRRNRDIEWQEQCRYFSLVHSRLDPVTQEPKAGWDGAEMIYAIPNSIPISGKAGRVVGGKLKQSGLRAGYPDINVDVARTVRGHVYHGLRIEMKQPQGVVSDVEPHQRVWHDKLRRQGYRVCVCFGWNEAWAVTCDYLGWEQ